MQSLLLLASLVVLGLACPCDDYPRPCPEIYRPVCATLRKTFSNQCELENQLCALAKDGFEYDDSEGQPQEGDCCVRPCPAIYEPVCAENGTIYPNKCQLAVARCEQKEWCKEIDMANCTTQQP